MTKFQLKTYQVPDDVVDRACIDRACFQARINSETL